MSHLSLLPHHLTRHSYISETPSLSDVPSIMPSAEPSEMPSISVEPSIQACLYLGVDIISFLKSHNLTFTLSSFNTALFGSITITQQSS